ncbi:condensation domain-containing protein [Streptomyces sp. AM 4-1-1]|uniref:condensation domain-containing protein n=1 Tax=Streptomyces sp. AM 4-1-1 TaxID=3028710 RepID=UPI0023B99472|nr:condensation domain-containing protein [Streptomyces sp. AM 4-1-1]WEH34414.1 condensation domain-containing protein [Streptomyces sp. AM 4-1-1]
MSQFTVAFSGLSHRTGPLSFGHANILRAITIDDDPTRLNLAMVFDAPADGGLDRVARQLHTLLARHESLRTTYRSATPVTQRVAGDGALTAEVVDGGSDPLETAERTARRLRSKTFDLSAELPFRVAVVTADGAPRHLVWVVSHAAMDVAACEVLHAEWHALSTGEPLPPAPASEPVDVVELERTPSIKRLGEGAVRYWESQIRQVPQAMFTLPHTAPAKNDWLHPGLNIRSRTVPAQLEAIAERTGASASAVALAALATLIGHRTRNESVTTTSLSGNRVVRKLHGFFGSLAQDALLPVDLSGAATFDDVVRQVRSAGLPAYRHSWFDPTAVWQVINGVSAGRGISFARDLVFNDMSALAAAAGSPDRSALGRLPGVWIPGHQPPLQEDAELGGGITWLPAEDIPCRFFICLYQLEEEFEVTLWIDPYVLDKDEAEEFGRSLLRLLRAAAGTELPLTELPPLITLPPVDRGEGWYLSDHSWIELDAVRELISEVVGDAPHLVTIEPDERLGHRLVCHLVAPAAPESVHERTLVALPGRVTAIAPHRYLVHPAAPPADGLADPAAWAALPVIADASGRAEGRVTA